MEQAIYFSSMSVKSQRLSTLGPTLSFVTHSIRASPVIKMRERYGLNPWFCSSVLALEIGLTLMGWSVIPIYALGICAAAFTVKVPIEVSV